MDSDRPGRDPKAPALEDPGDDETASSFVIEPRRVSSDRLSGMMPAEGVFVAPTTPALTPAAVSSGQFSGDFSLSPGLSPGSPGLTPGGAETKKRNA